MRRLLFALAVCLAVWAASARPESPQLGTQVGPSSPVGVASEAGVPQDSHHSHTRWVAGSRVIISTTESLWASSAFHADLATTRVDDSAARTVGVTRTANAGGSRPPHLLHVPLLI